MQLCNNIIVFPMNILVVLLENAIVALTLSSDQFQSKWSSAINAALDPHHISKEFVILVVRRENLTETTTTAASPGGGEFSSGNQLNKETAGKLHGKLIKHSEEVSVDKMIIDFHGMARSVMLLRMAPFFDRSVAEDTLRMSPGRIPSPVVFLLQHDKKPLEMIQTAMAMLSLLESWSRTAPHLVALKDENEESNGTAVQVLRELWRHKVSRAAVLQQGPQGFVLRWWKPQGHGRDCEGPSAKGLATKELSYHAAHRALPVRRPHNYFSGCVLYCSPFLWLPYAIEGDGGLVVDGLDFRVAEGVRKAMNFTTIYSVPDESYNQAGLNVRDGLANFSFGAFAFLEPFYPAMDPTVAYWHDSTVWFIPIGLPIPRWLSVTRVFSGFLWLGVFVSCILVTGAFAILRILYERVGYEGPKAVDAILMLLGLSAQEPSTPIGTWIFTVWLLSSLIINFAYQSGLIGFLANPGAYPPMSTAEELLQRKVKALIYPGYEVVLGLYDDPLIDTLVKNGVFCEDIIVCIDQVATSQGYALPTEIAFIDYGFKGNGRTKIKIMEYLSFYSIHTYLEKGSPLLEWFDFYISGMIEGNLNGKWFEEIIGSKEPLGQQSISRSDSPPVKMTVEHLQGVFFILLFGLVISSAVFIVEVRYLPRCRKFVKAEKK